MAFLGHAAVFGDLGQVSRFAQGFADSYARLWSDGTRATLQAYLDRGAP